MQQKKKPTIYDVAKESGYSIATVNRALNDKSNVNSLTKQRVLDAVDKLGYKPSRAAASLSRVPTKIAVIINSTIYGFISEVKRGIQHSADEYADFGLETDIFEIRDGERSDLRFFNKLQELMHGGYDGIIMLPNSELGVAELLNTSESTEKPVFATVVSNVPSSRIVFSVRSNGRVAGRMASDLLGMMHAKSSSVAIVTGKSDWIVHRETIQGFKERILDNHLELKGVYEHFDNPAIAFSLADKLLEEIPDIGGIYFSSANSVTFCKRLIELGRIHDINIVTSDIFPEIEALINDGYVNATIFQDPFNQGKMVLKYMYEYIAENRRFHESDILLNPSIILKSNLELYKKNIEFIKNDRFI